MSVDRLRREGRKLLVAPYLFHRERDDYRARPHSHCRHAQILFAAHHRSSLVCQRRSGNHVNWRFEFAAPRLRRHRLRSSISLCHCEYCNDLRCGVGWLRLSSFGCSVRYRYQSHGKCNGIVGSPRRPEELDRKNRNLKSELSLMGLPPLLLQKKRRLACCCRQPAARLRSPEDRTTCCSHTSALSERRGYR